MQSERLSILVAGAGVGSGVGGGVVGVLDGTALGRVVGWVVVARGAIGSHTSMATALWFGGQPRPGTAYAGFCELLSCVEGYNEDELLLLLLLQQ